MTVCASLSRFLSQLKLAASEYHIQGGRGPFNIFIWSLPSPLFLSGISHSFDFDCIIFKLSNYRLEVTLSMLRFVFNLSLHYWWAYPGHTLCQYEAKVFPDKSSNGLHLPFGFMSPFFDGFVFTRGIFAFFSFLHWVGDHLSLIYSSRAYVEALSSPLKRGL